MKQLYLHRNKHREAVSVKRQRNMSQMKEQNQTPEKELNEMKTSNLPDAVFKTLVIMMLNELRGRVDLLHFLRFYLFAFRERGRKREIEGEKH